MKTLHQETLELLKQNALPLRQIAEESGLPYDWLVGVRYDRIKEPGVNRIQRLYEYLTGTRLPV